MFLIEGAKKALSERDQLRILRCRGTQNLIESFQKEAPVLTKEREKTKKNSYKQNLELIKDLTFGSFEN
jgi:hypothetical protein